MNNVQFLRKLIFVLSIVCTFLVLKAKADSYDEKAKQILDLAGVKGGLIVHLGCGDGRLTKALRVNDSFIVHGLDGHTVTVEKARTNIRDEGIYGTISAELFSGKVLPYTDRLVNPLVAEDLGNVPMKGVKRVLVPDGVAYIKQNNRRSSHLSW